ncbi:MAG: RluA family pseudouridine synthase [Planctomycetes bacterium]|nr:RluA family pseudouridine synthase [Planctomycetota bacterium]
MSSESPSVTISGPHVQQTLAAVVRALRQGESWSQARKLIAARRVRIGGEVCLDAARRLKEGDIVEVVAQAAPRPAGPDEIVIRHLDRDIVVVEKPAGMCTVRHPAERAWKDRRRALSPTLEDLVRWQIRRKEESKGESKGGKRQRPRLRIVHRLDKETSGLVVFARTVPAEQGLGKQFQKHTVIRKYLAIVPGHVKAQTVRSQLVRDRGDGRRGSRGSSHTPGLGKLAVTHIDVVEKLAAHTLLSCRLETGRTHQIRIHLAELGHPLCGEKVYDRKPGAPPAPDRAGQRLALHAVELGFVHPTRGGNLHWTMPLPADLERLLDALRARSTRAK